MARRFATIVPVRAPRRLAALVALAAALLAAAPAGASDHTMRIDEVQLSAGGDPTAQFVELRDSTDEPFTDQPYRLVVFDGGGTRVGHHEIGNALAGVDATQPFTLASATSGGGDQVLGVALPAGAGRLCFTAGLGERVITCVAYGCATAGSLVTPPDGQSLQRQAGGSYQLAAPTPEAANSAGAAATCPAAGGGGTTTGGGTGTGGGTTGGGPTGGDGTAPGSGPGTTPAERAPVLTVARRLRLNRLRIRLRPRAAGCVRARATVRRGGRAVTIATGRRSLSGTAPVGLTLRPSRRGRSVAARALARTGRAAATLVLTFTDAAGRQTTLRRRFTLLR